ncbi:hypothetical protein, partial [Telmatospirillum siberiense]
DVYKRQAHGRASFEIQVSRGNHWIMEDYRETESAARAVAKKILAKHQYEGVRVVKNWLRGDGVVTETVVFVEMASAQPLVNVTIVPIEMSPYCRKTEEYYRLESRGTINRLFRKYLERVYLTPTELIHNYKALKKIQAVETLFPAAVDRVATIQARFAGEEPRDRRDEVYRAVARMTSRAREADEHPGLPKLKGDDFGKILAKIEQFAAPDDVNFYSLVVLSRDLVERRSWLAKLERLVLLTDPAQRVEAFALLDGVIADLFGVPSALQDVLGVQRNLAEALCAIADLYDGRFDNERSDARGQLAILSPLLAGGRLEETRRALLERLLRQLSGVQPLNRHDPSREREAFREVARRLFRPDGLMGGADAAEALTRRFVLLGQAGGQAGLRQAVGGVVVTLADPLFSVTYLLELAASPLGAGLIAEILANLHRLIGVPDINFLAPAASPVKDKLLRITRIYEVIASTGGVPDGERARLLDRLDEVLSGYIKREGVIERLDNPSAPLRDRAIRLLEFCAARVLPPASKAQALARERVVALLRQPNFEERCVADISSPARGEEVLRNLHALMARGGFRLH